MNTLSTIVFSNMAWHVLIACGITFIVNLPFGYFRGSFRKLSFLWFLMIHLPVPLVIYIRKINGLQLTWALAPILLGSFFLGQFIGRKIYKLIPLKKPEK